MKTLERYIGRAVIEGILLSALVLVILVSFFSLMDELQDVGEGNYQTSDAFVYSLLMVPRWAYDVFPISVLIGSLISLGGLAGGSELIAMRAAGVSVARIVFAAVKAGAVLMVGVVLLGEFVAPETDQIAESMRAERISQQITLKSRYGFWARDGDSFVNIRKILPGARLEDIYIYEFRDDGRLKLATYAGFAQYQQDHWLLRGIRQSEFYEDRVESRTMERATWDSMLNPSLLSVVVVKPTMLSAWGLYKYIDFMRENGQKAIQYEVAFWSKMVMPLVTLVMVFLSVPFVFGVLRSVGIGQRVFIGTLIGALFFLLNKVFEHMAVVYELNPLFAASFPGLAVFGAALWYFRRMH